MAPTQWTYLDYLQSKDPREPVGIGGNNPLEKVYAFDPIPSELPPELAKHILGGQAQIWTEYMPNAKHVEYMAWPRLCALAESVWSTAEGARLGWLQAAPRRTPTCAASSIWTSPTGRSKGRFPTASTIP